MKLSIITINYNNCAGLQKTIDSILSQTWKDFEWIVIDGGSTDGSRELIEQHKEFFSYWCSEPDKGVYNAMNKGIAHAKGEYLNFMNSGDVFYEADTLGKVFSSEHTADMVYGDWVRVLPGNEVYKASPETPSVYFFYQDNICHQAMFVRNSVLTQRGYDENYKILADMDRWQQLSLSGGTFERVSLPVCKFDAIGGLSETPSERRQCEVEMLKEKYPDWMKQLFSEYKHVADELSEYEECKLTRDTLQLAYERPIYCKLIHINLIMIKGIRRIIDFFAK